MNIQTKSSWQKDNWKKLPRVQQPNWLEHADYNLVCEKLSTLPPLVFAGEIVNLKNDLVTVEKNESFILQCGDCAETFAGCNATVIRENLKILLQMSIILTHAAGKHVVKIGRVAGQYAKPRSSDFETINQENIPSYRGDMVNSDIASLSARAHDPNRMLQAYFHATATLNLLRGYTKGGFAALSNVHKWNKEFMKLNKQSNKYEELAKEIDRNLDFINAVGLNQGQLSQINQVDLYTSHEALILEYEQALTRTDTLSNKIFDCSGHMLWIGNRTRSFDGAHVDFLSGVENPIGIKIDAKLDVSELKLILNKLNPENLSGKIVLIGRFGIDNVEKALPAIAQSIKGEGYNLSFICDPMHGNTISLSGYKTRNFNTIQNEILLTQEILQTAGLHLAGIHLEATGLNVTECIGGDQEIDDKTLNINYATNCDPRLNSSQSVELAFQLAKRLS